MFSFVLYYIKVSQMVYNASQLTGFYIKTARNSEG